MYFSVLAKNGFGVYNNLEKYQNSREYMKKPKRKSFKTLAEAKDYVLDMYNDYRNCYSDLDFYYDPANDPKFRINWFYSQRYIKKLNSAGRLQDGLK